MIQRSECIKLSAKKKKELKEKEKKTKFYRCTCPGNRNFLEPDTKDAATDMTYFARSKFYGSLVHKKKNGWT